MNLKEIRDAMFAQADWAPAQSPEATSRVNNFINRAYNQLALDAPFLFFESKVHLATEPDVSSLAGNPDADLYDRIKLAGNNTLPIGTLKDPWTWEVTFNVGQAETADNKLNVWQYDRSWDGRMIEITVADGTVIRNQIRSIWRNKKTATASEDVYTFTLAIPWEVEKHGDGTAGVGGKPGFTYRIYTEAYGLPDDLIQLNSARLRDNTNNFPLDVVGQREAEELQLDGPPAQVASGIPRCVFRRQHIHMQGPSVAPVASPAVTDPKNFSPSGVFSIPKDPTKKTESRATFDNAYTEVDLAAGETVESSVSSDNEAHISTPWLGPEPAGTFEYKVTYTWGKRDAEFQLPGLGHWEGYAQPVDLFSDTSFLSRTQASTDPFGDTSSRNRFRTPRFESPPSQASNAMSAVRVQDRFAAIKLSLPNITYALGFLNKTGAYSRISKNNSGVYIRIYRRRLATDMGRYDTLEHAMDGLSSSQLDSADAFYLLAEFRADTSNGGVWYDNGEFLPDYSRRLRDVHGYQTMQFYPKPDKRYAVEMRAVVRPTKLTDDRDTPLVHAEAINVLIEKAMTYLYENMGQSARSEASLARYKELLLTLSNRYADLRPASVPVLRRMTRATGVRTNRRWNRRLSTDDLGGVVE